jgi:hypothetical protein
MKKKAFIFALAAILPLAAPLYAKDGKTDKKEAKIEASFIAAKSAGEGEAKKPLPQNYKDVEKRIFELFALDSFELLSSKTLEGAFGAEMTAEIPGKEKRILKIKVAKNEKKDGKFAVNLQIEGLLAADYSVEQGGVLVVGGLKLDDGKSLVISIRLKSAKP